MGNIQRILNGARAQLIVNGKIVGLFTNCNWGVRYDAQANHILGRYSPAEITYTGQEPISVRATGFRVVDNGAYVAAGVPMLQQLLTDEDFSLAILDRQTGKTIFVAIGVRALGYESAVAARSVSDFTVEFMGLRAEDESGAQGESPGASDLLSGS